MKAVRAVTLGGGFKPAATNNCAWRGGEDLRDIAKSIEMTAIFEGGCDGRALWALGHRVSVGFADALGTAPV